VLLTGGGIIPLEDAQALTAQGYAKLFGPGTPTEEIARWIEAEMQRRWQSEGVQA
jgi:methylmalonyl-CoA mutase C-terminal domain/subunit